eukprot:jgi/Psemu1/25977/gm1.25977_g
MLQKLNADPVFEKVLDSANTVAMLKFIKKICYKYEPQKFPPLAAICVTADLTTDFDWHDQFENLVTATKACKLGTSTLSADGQKAVKEKVGDMAMATLDIKNSIHGRHAAIKQKLENDFLNTGKQQPRQDGKAHITCYQCQAPYNDIQPAGESWLQIERNTPAPTVGIAQLNMGTLDDITDSPYQMIFCIYARSAAGTLPQDTTWVFDHRKAMDKANVNCDVVLSQHRGKIEKYCLLLDNNQLTVNVIYKEQHQVSCDSSIDNVFRIYRVVVLTAPHSTSSLRYQAMAFSIDKTVKGNKEASGHIKYGYQGTDQACGQQPYPKLPKAHAQPVSIAALPPEMPAANISFFATVGIIKNAKAETLAQCMQNVKDSYPKRGFTISTVRMDKQFEPTGHHIKAGIGYSTKFCQQLIGNQPSPVGELCPKGVRSISNNELLCHYHRNDSKQTASSTSGKEQQHKALTGISYAPQRERMW